jgi:hypothetical protein
MGGQPTTQHPFQSIARDQLLEIHASSPGAICRIPYVAAISGMAFTLFDGWATWDCAGK